MGKENPGEKKLQCEAGRKGNCSLTFRRSSSSALGAIVFVLEYEDWRSRKGLNSARLDGDLGKFFGCDNDLTIARI